MPWLEDSDPQISWPAKFWRYPLFRRHLSIGPALKEADCRRAYVIHHFPQGSSPTQPIEPGPDENLGGAFDPENSSPTTTIPPAYSDFADVFSAEAAAALPASGDHDHRIELEDGASPPWGPIYPLSSVELETLRTYLEDAQRRGWIRPSTSPAGAPILFVPKKGGKLRLCVDY